MPVIVRKKKGPAPVFDPSTLYTEKEVAEKFGFNRQTLSNWRYRNQGPVWIMLTPKSLRYAGSDLNVWLQAQKVVPTGSV